MKVEDEHPVSRLTCGRVLSSRFATVPSFGGIMKKFARKTPRTLEITCRTGKPILVTFFVLFLFPILHAVAAPATPGRLELHQGWALQSSCKATQGGEVI